ncbi:MAG: hypothetical protein ACRC4J_03555 [Cetobacterium sp.]
MSRVKSSSRSRSKQGFSSQVIQPGKKTYLAEIEEDSMISAINRKKFPNSSIWNLKDSDTKSSMIEPTTTQPEASTVTEEKPKLFQVTESELEKISADKAQKLISEKQSAIENELASIKDKFESQLAELKFQNDQIKSERDKSDAEAKRLADVFAVTGYSNPNTKPADVSNSKASSGFGVNYLSFGPTKEPMGAAREFMRIYESSSYTPISAVVDNDGQTIVQRDFKNLERFVREEKKSTHHDMENWMKGIGLLKGSSSAYAGNTGSITIPDAFLDFLSIMQRQSHSPQYIWWQFALEKLELGRVPGTNILVPRFNYLDEPQDEADYILDTAEYSVNIPSDNQAISMSTSPITLKGYGLGLGNKVGNRPVSIPEFVMSTSLVELQQALSTRLLQNYHAFEDMLIRRVYQTVRNKVENIFYNNNGAATNTPGDVAVGDDGTLSETFLNSVYSQLANRNILPYDNGKYVLTVPPIPVAQFRSSLDEKIAVPSESQLQEITNILRPYTIGDGLDKPSGYLGEYCGFMLFEGSSWGTGATGAEGVQTTTFGAGASTTRSSYAFGKGAVGRGSSLPFQIRQDGAGQFGTKMRFIWRSIEGVGALDVANITTPVDNGQQDRVFEIRTSDVAV